MRRLWVVLVLAAAGCAARPETVTGPAAPIIVGSGPATTASATPTGRSAAPPGRADYTTLTTTGFGVSVRIPVPVGWTRELSSTAGLTRTDVDLVDPQVLLRIDLSARGRGSAQDGTLRNEKSAGLAGYRRLGIAPVPDVGDDAVDWTFTFERDGTRQVVDRQIVSGTAGVAVYYSAPQKLYRRYLPVWKNAVRGLSITTS